MSNLDKMLRDFQREQRQACEALSEIHWSDPDASIPDLEFLTPECPICTTPTEYDDGVYTCPVCIVTWPRNGYGHQATRYAE